MRLGAVGLGIVGLGIVGVASCAKHEEAAVAELEKVDAACAKQDRDGARQLLRDAAEKNPVFKEAYEKSKANWNVTDDSKVNPCGIFLADVRKRLTGS